MMGFAAVRAVFPPALVARFAGVGILNTLLTLALIVGMKSVFQAPDPLANFTGYLAGLALSFVLNKRWTFQHNASTAMAAVRFLLVFGVAYAINLATVLVLIRLGCNAYAAHVAGMPVYTVMFYLGCRLYAFKPAAQTLPGVQAQAASRWFLAALAGLLTVMLYRLGGEPVAVWDEARLANNALEMAQSGLSLVTTYGGLPDHWNTKPPLLIWLMAASIRLFGIVEWAMRLPSALAAIATGCMVYWFGASRLQRPFAGFLAVVFLLATPGFFVAHGARAGDYDAILTMWTTAYLLCAYQYLQTRGAEQMRWLAAFTACAGLAFMTKTIQGLMFLPAPLLYLLFDKDSRSVLRHKSLYLSALLLFLVGGAYYAARESADPGYFHAALANDLGGRFGTTIEHHDGPPWWYLGKVTAFPWLLPSMLMGAFTFRNYPAERARANLYLLTALLFYLIVISAASTKLPWYAIPLAPLSALLMGIGLDRMLALRRERLQADAATWNRRVVLACAAVAVGVVGCDIATLQRHATQMAADQYGQYGVFLRDEVLALPGAAPIVIVHPGYPNDHGDPFYTAPVQFYAAALRAHGHSVSIVRQLPSQLAPGSVIVSCGPAAGSAGVLARRGQCVAYRPDRPSPLN